MQLPYIANHHPHAWPHIYMHASHLNLIIRARYIDSMGSTHENDNGTGHGLHIVMFPFLAFGHISPFVQLARKLTDADSTIHVTFISAPANVQRITSLLPRSDANIHISSIPLPPFAGLPPGAESTAELTAHQAELLKLAVDAMKPDVEALLDRIRPHFIMFDFAMPWVPSIAAPLRIKSLFFTVFAAVADAYLTVPSRRPPGTPITPTAQDLKKPPPGFPAKSAVAAGVPDYQAQNFSYIFKTFGDDSKPCVYDRVVSCMSGCDAIVTKTCMEMEGEYVQYLESEYKKPVLVAGPTVNDPPSGELLETRWQRWLDGFNEGSVVYSSFGSEVFLTEHGTRELLLGLEKTGRPFLVVLNCPEGEEAMRRKLPEGFERRTKERGVVHYGWVQQQLILQHKNVGCYVMHAGLSSIIEGVMAGCRLVMLPLRGDQFLNSALFVGDLGVGVEVPREAMTGDFDREGVYESVEKAMVQESTETRETQQHKKWREFLGDKQVAHRFTTELLEKLNAFK